MKCTAIAPSNLAFIKYWGKSDEKLKTPLNGSISMNLSGMKTTTTVEFSDKYEKDEIEIAGIVSVIAKIKIINHLDLIRKLANTKMKARVFSKNSFPSSTGLSSSASGFAALTVAGAKASGLKLSEKEMTALSRQGSGSSARSIPDGFVEWLKGTDSKTSIAYSIFPPEWFEIADIVAVISTAKKEISSTDGQRLIQTSPFLPERIRNIPDKIEKIKSFIKKRDYTSFGNLAESEALEMHAVMMTSKPALIYWQPETVTLMKFVRFLRNNGLEVYFSLNTGQDIHIICRKKDVNLLISELKKKKEIREMIINYPDKGTYTSENHLF
jgi:diphosphomevalonate decarboxylase